MTNIASGLESLTVPIDRPELHPNNYRRGDVSGIAESLSRFGQLRPIVVQQSSGYVVAGNHTLRAARELGWAHIAAVTIELADDEAEAYLVADNRLSDKASNDDAVLAPILERLMVAGRLEGTGYSPDDVDDMLSALDALPEVDPGGTEATHAAGDDELRERFANRSQVALRQFVLMYDQDTATEVEGMFRRLERAWGVSGARDVVLEALRRASAEPPVEGLTVAEAERANAPEPAVAPDGRGAPPDEEGPAEPLDPTAASAGSTEPPVSSPPATSVTDDDPAADPEGEGGRERVAGELDDGPGDGDYSTHPAGTEAAEPSSLLGGVPSGLDPA